ncbi:MAG TPA: sigma 54-interacting transcriptional regulator [Methylibium sp.]|nr:sigma 54-interacting transcriptional regulator [Methylibium sp.]
MPRPPRAAPTVEQAADDRTLTEHLRFSPDAGHIVLFDQRMLLMHASSFAELRRELIEQLGTGKARELFTRLGYQQGFEDGQRIRTLCPDDRDRMLALGPRLREIEGFVRNQPIDAMRYDVARGEFWGDYYWTASWEAEAHLNHCGVFGEPACWMMVGYASGYCAAVVGLPILWREVECMAMGHERCRVVGRPLAAWDDLAEHETNFLKIEPFVRTPSRPRHVDPPAGGRPRRAATATEFDDFVGTSAGFNAVANLVKRVGVTDSTVLFRGESGVGKERFARALHSVSRRREQAMVSINCAAIPPDLVEAELFGVEKGAYTGADRARPGRFERAHGGTLFLDEISSLPLPAQGKLLRALQEREIERVGDTRVRKVDVRLVAASNRDLRDEVEAGRFREDLFYRLNVFPIVIPPLRERLEDIPLLVALFLERCNRRCGKRVSGLTPRAYDALWDYHWPGNVRELENMVERAVILADDEGTIDVQHLFSGGERLELRSLGLGADGGLVPPARPGGRGGADGEQCKQLADALLAQLPSFEQIESLLFERALERSDGNVSAAARLLRLRRGQVEYRLQKKRSPGRAGEC